METGEYRIEILHFLNPHLIWIERKYTKNDTVLEQIGIFGILPLVTAITGTGELVSEKAINWMSVVNNVIQDFRENTNEVYFVPIHIDRRNSIFNDNIHKFGEIYGYTNKKKVYLSDTIVKYGYGYLDEGSFHENLSAGNIKTKLTTVKINEVVNTIKKYCKDSPTSLTTENVIERQTSIFTLIKDIGHTLTAKNLELHNKNSKHIDRIDIFRVIENKTNDLNLCKYDDDEAPVGRGFKRNQVTDNYSVVSDQSSLIIERLKNKASTNEVFKATKRYLDMNSSKRTSLCENNSEIDVVKESLICKENINSCNKDSAKKKYDLTDHKGSLNTEKTPPKINKIKKRLVAYGPPMSQKLDYTVKAIDDFDDIYTPLENKREVEETPWNEENQLDSDINIKITNINTLKDIRNKNQVIDAVKLTQSLNNAISNSEIDKGRVDGNADIKDRSDANIDIEDVSINANIDIKDTNINASIDIEDRSNANADIKDRKIPSFLENKLKYYKDKVNKTPVIDKKNSLETHKDSEDEDLKEKLNPEYAPLLKAVDQPKIVTKTEKNVNPFKNWDVNKSVFVEKLISPILMVHTKNDNLVLPQTNLRDINFKDSIKSSLKVLRVNGPSRLQSVSWPYILRGHSVFIISPLGTGKTLGYIPSVCNLAIDFYHEVDSVGPIIIIVCATTKSVTEVAKICSLFIGDKVLPCYHGLDSTNLIASVLNGCDILVTTPPMLHKLLVTDLGVDLKRLTTVVLDDCEHLSDVYMSDIKVLQYYIKDMLKNRADKKMKVQYVVASRKWCDFMTGLAKNAPDTIVAIAAFQECVLYSKTNTTVNFVMKDKKVKTVTDFLEEIDRNKRTVIVCREDDEVKLLEKVVTSNGFTVFACDNTMTIQDLYNINVAWSTYDVPNNGPILICCDGNLTHINVTNAYYLIHYSMPELFSMFCKRFAVLNDNYASIFGPQKDDVKIKVLLEENNLEQLPKILNFVKRCTKEIPDCLEEVSRKVLEVKDLDKAEKFVPICDNLLMFSECTDIWNCQQRHAILKGYDEPKQWMPTNGLITFKILHYDSAVSYSARLLSNITKLGATKYPKTYSTLSLKMGMYYSKEINRKLHGIPKLGDVCAVAIKQNFFVRCRVIKIVNYYKGNPHHVLVNLIDEEQLETVKDVDLYYLPNELRSIETHVVKVRLANIKPQDKDVTFSEIAKNLIKNVTDKSDELYLRGQVVLTINNTIFIDSLEACQDLALNNTVVKRNFKNDLLENHATINPEHVNKLKELCLKGGIDFKEEDASELPKTQNLPVKCDWAYLPENQMINVALTTAINPGKFFVCLPKFRQCTDSLKYDVRKYLNDEPKSLDSVSVGDIVLAEFPDDKVYERARIEKVIDNKVLCFFVDNGDRAEVDVNNLRHIPQNLIEQLPFQAIECRLVGITPPNKEWTEFSINWFSDSCYNQNGQAKQLYAKYYVKEKADITGGHCYGVVLVDTNTDIDTNINKMMIELNLAKENKLESMYLNETINIEFKDDSSDDETIDFNRDSKDFVHVPIKEINLNKQQENDENTSQDVAKQINLNDVFRKPIRSVPLVSDNVKINDCDVNFSNDMIKKMGLDSLLGSMKISNSNVQSTLPMIGPNKPDIESMALKTELSKDTSQIIEKDVSKILDTTPKDEEYSRNSIEAIESLKSNATDMDSDDLSDSEGNLDKDEINPDSEISLEQTPTKELDDPKIVVETENTTISPKSNIFVLQAQNNKNKKEKMDDSKIDSDDFSTDVSAEQSFVKIIDTNKKPKVVWKQNKTTVTLKIQLIGVEKYSMNILERSIEFSCYHNDTKYEFNIELYGIINTQKVTHSNKGQYILVTLHKILQKNWLNLCKDCKLNKWIVYDVDGIDTSSDEEEDENGEALKVLRENYEKQDSDSDDFDFVDDVSFRHRRCYED